MDGIAQGSKAVDSRHFALETPERSEKNGVDAGCLYWPKYIVSGLLRPLKQQAVISGTGLLQSFNETDLAEKERSIADGWELLMNFLKVDSRSPFDPLQAQYSRYLGQWLFVRLFEKWGAQFEF